MGNPLPAFDPDFAGPAQWAAMYRAIGLQIIPGWLPGEPAGNAWKRPYLSHWQPLQEALVPQAQFERWYGPTGEHAGRGNMGLITGRCSGNAFMIDLDVHKHPEAAAWWNAVLEVENSGIDLETIEQRTGGGGIQKLFLAPDGFVVPTIKTSIGVDIRGQGGFAVLPPSLHESGRHYDWLPGRAPWEIAIEVAPAWLLEAITDLAEAHGGGVVNDKIVQLGPHSSVQMSGQTSGEQVLNEFGTVIDGREHLMRDVVWHAVLELYRAAPIKPQGPELEAAMAASWASYEMKVATRVAGADKLSGLAQEDRGRKEFGRKWKRVLRLWDSPKMKAEAAKPPPVIEPAGPRASEPPPKDNINDPAAEFQSHPPSGVPLVSAFPIDEASIPTRNWIVPGLLLLKNLSVLVAPPGSGKSLFTLQLAIAAAVGMTWSGWTPRRPVKVLVVNAEDDLDEMRRRLFAAAKEMGVDHARLEGRLFLADAPETIVIARMDAKTKTVIRTPLGEQLVATILVEGIELVVADPFAETFEGDENSNSEVKWAGILWREVARRAACALLLVHHTKKYAGEMAGNADASRGGGALIGTARILSTLFVMTEDEAAAMNIQPDDRLRYVRFDDAKANHSRMEAVRWFEKKTITLNNGTGLVPGDDVGVLVPWLPPGALDGISVHSINLALDEIDRGIAEEDGPPKRRYAATAAGARNDRWVGHLLMRMLGCSEVSAKKLIKDWLKTEVLTVIEYDDPVSRKPQKGLCAPQKNRPGTGETFT